jgi:uncharacterized membrane protein YhaH (DUF805 family)
MEKVFAAYTKKYFTFSGRASRSEYWLCVVAYMVLYIVAVILDFSFGLWSVEAGIGTFSAILVVAVLIPSIAVSVRRLHDTNRVGWWLLIIFVPLFGAIALIVMHCLKGTDGDNRFGPNPLLAASE